MVNIRVSGLPNKKRWKTQRRIQTGCWKI